jgi:AmmeMemoRadiSam system protein B/AmmeMemoRadiSam system protein A
MGKVRPASCAGYWYTKNPQKLSSEINNYLNNAEKENLNVKAVIVPHAGYMYSGEVAAHSFKQLNENVSKVILLGTAHRYPLRGANVIDYEYYDSPLGKVKVSNDVKNFLNEKNIVSIIEADEEEHSIEIEIPFLQNQLKDFSILPVIVGRIDTEEFSGLLEKYYDDNTVIVASVDLSHFHNYQTATKLDNHSIKSILTLNDEAIEDSEIDSPFAIMSLILLAKKKGWKTKLLCYKNSGDVTGDNSSVVGYSSIVFYEAKIKFSDSDKKYLEKLSRGAVETYIKTGKAPEVREVPKNLRENLACFVTIYNKGDLRGCIGTIQPYDELYKSVIENAISAATRDARFNPIDRSELHELDYEVSILTRPKDVEFSTKEDLFRGIKGKGVILEKGNFRSTYLPQVWEHFSDEAEFLSSLCRKAGLSGNDWKILNKSGIRYQVYDIYK